MTKLGWFTNDCSANEPITPEDNITKPTPLRTHILSAYYGILQTLHLLVLIRAGGIMLLKNRFPFPILPPSEGWAAGVLPFMLGLAAADSIGILLGMVFAYQAVFKARFNPRLGVISLTIFITGAVVFAAGTLPSGAWATHPVAYGAMVVLFLPALVLYAWLLWSPPAS